jgi:hypothetical protein
VAGGSLAGATLTPGGTVVADSAGSARVPDELSPDVPRDAAPNARDELAPTASAAARVAPARPSPSPRSSAPRQSPAPSSPVAPRRGAKVDPDGTFAAY